MSKLDQACVNKGLSPEFRSEHGCRLLVVFPHVGDSLFGVYHSLHNGLVFRPRWARPRTLSTRGGVFEEKKILNLRNSTHPFFGKFVIF